MLRGSSVVWPLVELGCSLAGGKAGTIVVAKMTTFCTYGCQL